MLHKFPFTVAYADTDASGIAYHARYIEMAERARMNWSRGMKIPDGDLGFVVRELDIKYNTPLKVADEIIIETIATEIGMASVKIEQRFLRDGIVCAVMHIKIAYLGADLRPKQIPDSIIQMMK